MVFYIKNFLQKKRIIYKGVGMTTLLFLGDIIGQPGRKAIGAVLPDFITQEKIDFVVANGENAAAGFGVTPAIVAELNGFGVDVITTGNHIWDQKELVQQIDSVPRLLRPLNYPRGTPGRGVNIFTARNGQKIAVLNVMGRLFMDALDNPFAAVDEALSPLHLGVNVAAIIVDVHAEASSEKQVMAYHLDGRVSMVVGSHTHVPTADARILPYGTAYQTDAGMCGDYESVIGMDRHIAVPKMVKKLPTKRLEPATGAATMCGVLVRTNAATGLAMHIQPVVLGEKFRQSWA
jgi:2',3'-cyclic-nucleotide 2'-phosphodiesterase